MLKRSLVLAALCGMSFAATAVTIDLRPVSYTHLTLPTTERV